jgi:flagellar biogenesis protein FliO
MNAASMAPVSSAAVLIAGLLQLAFLLWIVIFPIVIIRKLNQISEKLSGK